MPAASFELPFQGRRYQGVEKGSAGYRLLETMGWKEGEGLGAEGQGIKEHIKVKKKMDSMGVGKAEDLARSAELALAMVNFDRVLSNLSEVRSTQSAECSDVNYVQPSSGCVAKEGVRLEAKTNLLMSSRKENNKKKKEKKLKTKRKKEVQWMDTDCGKEVKKCRTRVDLASDGLCCQKGRKKKVSHIGRFRRQEVAKLVRNYSSTDMAAILGGTVVETMSADSTAQSNNVTAAVKSGTSAQAIRQDTEEQRSSSGKGGSRSGHSADQGAESLCRAWWQKRFVRAGSLDDMKCQSTTVLNPRVKCSIKASGFSEDDQTALYNSVQGLATSGKKGLGESGVLRKVAGVKLGGAKRTTFADSDGDGMGDSVVTTKGSEEFQTGETCVGSEIVGGDRVVSRDAWSSECCGAKIKWKKIAVKVLSDSGKRRMKIGRFTKRALQLVAVDVQGKERRMMVEKLMKAVGKSQHVQVECQHVVLNC